MALPCGPLAGDAGQGPVSPRAVALERGGHAGWQRGKRGWPQPCPARALSRCLNPLLLESRTGTEAVKEKGSAQWPLGWASPLITSLMRLSSNAGVSPGLGFTCLQILPTAWPRRLRSLS